MSYTEELLPCDKSISIAFEVGVSLGTFVRAARVVASNGDTFVRQWVL